MNGNLYELIAIGARYLFAAIMVIIVIRAWKITIIDSRRAGRLRRLSPETGVCGEFLVMTGSGKVRDGMRFPVIREGLIGSSRKADIRLRSRDIHRTHAFFELTPSGLRLRAQGRSRMYNVKGEAKKEIVLPDGGMITFGEVELMLVLTEAAAAASVPEREELFDIPDDSDVFTRRPFVTSDYDDEPVEDCDSGSPSPYAPPRDSGRVFHEDVSPGTPESYEELIPEDPDDLFMENSPATLKPEDDDPWDDEPKPSVHSWDDWEEPSAKPKVKRRQYDDPFDSM